MSKEKTVIKKTKQKEYGTNKVIFPVSTTNDNKDIIKKLLFELRMKTKKSNGDLVIEGLKMLTNLGTKINLGTKTKK